MLCRAVSVGSWAQSQGPSETLCPLQGVEGRELCSRLVDCSGCSLPGTELPFTWAGTYQARDACRRKLRKLLARRWQVTKGRPGVLAGWVSRCFAISIYRAPVRCQLPPGPGSTLKDRGSLAPGLRGR